MSDEVFKKYLKLLTVVGGLLIVCIAVYFLFFSGVNVVNPADNVLDDDPEAGKSYALLYEQGDLFENINENEDNLGLIQEDLALFARTTRPEFTSEDILLGFTLEDDFSEDGSTYTHNGYFYGLDDRIRLIVDVLDGGVITLSITNTDDNTNIDDSLQLNGEVNELIRKLPIETDFYSLRYYNDLNKILAVFYLGYSEQDIAEVESILLENLGENYDEEEVVFSINSIGRSDQERIRQFVNDPRNVF